LSWTRFLGAAIRRWKVTGRIYQGERSKRLSFVLRHILLSCCSPFPAFLITLETKYIHLLQCLDSLSGEDDVSRLQDRGFLSPARIRNKAAGFTGDPRIGHREMKEQEDVKDKATKFSAAMSVESVGDKLI
jgi:hypothetical protein